MLKVFIGYDPREPIAYSVLAHSIITRASRPVSIHPLMLSQLGTLHSRPRSPQQSTDFAYSRFLTPFLAGGENEVSIFLDSDMLCLTDICQLENLGQQNYRKDVLVVKHDYTPTTYTKFYGQAQTNYPCKNWSSVMVFNGWRSACRALTPGYVNAASGMDLHQFKWADDVGELPVEWNHLVGEYAPNPEAKIVHYTLGGPYLKGYSKCEYAEEWFTALASLLHAEERSFELIRHWI